jgi:hypothetical protein
MARGDLRNSQQLRMKRRKVCSEILLYTIAGRIFCVNIIPDIPNATARFRFVRMCGRIKNIKQREET